jgi:protein gp37
MSDKTGIEWTRSDDGTSGATWNPVTGCDRLSPGCDHCYALTFAERWRGVPGHYFEHGFDVQLRPDKLDQPLRWTRPRRIFVNSMSDLFHQDVPDGYIACVFTVMAKAPQHTFQMLTKRHARMRSLLSSDKFQVLCHAAAASRGWDLEGTPWPLPNVHLGVSAEDQHWADIRIPALLRTPAAVRFVSAEPLLGRVDLRVHLAGWCPEHDFDGGFCVQRNHPGVRRPDWLIIGGESGPGARRMDEEWARTLAIQAVRARVPVFMKQFGSKWARENNSATSKGSEPSEWPSDLQVRQFPNTSDAALAR